MEKKLKGVKWQGFAVKERVEFCIFLRKQSSGTGISVHLLLKRKLKIFLSTKPLHEEG